VGLMQSGYVAKVAEAHVEGGPQSLQLLPGEREEPKFVAAIDEGVIVWCADGSVAQRLDGGEKALTCAVAVDGKHIVSADTKGTVRLWSAETFTALGELPKAEESCGTVKSLAIFGDLVVTGYERSLFSSVVKYQSIRGGTPPQTLRAIQINPQGTGFSYATGFSNGLSRVAVDASHIAASWNSRGDEAFVASVHLVPTATALTAGAKPEAPEEERCASAKFELKHPAQVDVVLLNGNVLLTSSADHRVRLFDLGTGECTRTIDGSNLFPWGQSMGPDLVPIAIAGSLLIASGARADAVQVWDLNASGSPVDSPDNAGNGDQACETASVKIAALANSGRYSFAVSAPHGVVATLQRSSWDRTITLEVYGVL